jgi:hypothetical protein
MKTLFAIAVLAAVAPFATAQQRPPPEPANPTAPVLTFKYESAFSGYRGFREEPLAPWRDVNDEVARAGGHIGIVGGAHGGHASGNPAIKPAPPQPQTKAVPAAKTKPEVTSPPAGPGDEHDH